MEDRTELPRAAEPPPFARVSETPATAIPLTYARPVSQLGVVISRDSTGIQVIVPRVRGWRAFVNAKWGFIISLGWLGVFFAMTEPGPLRYSFRLLGLGVVFLSFAGYRLFTFWRQRIFLVNSQEVCFGYLRGRKVLWESRWPRQAIADIKLNPFSGRLLIRVAGQDMKEYVISSRKDVTQEVADVLKQALVEYSAAPVDAANGFTPPFAPIPIWSPATDSTNVEATPDTIDPSRVAAAFPDAPQFAGVMLESDESCVRVLLPAVRSWRGLSPLHGLALLFAGILLKIAIRDAFATGDSATIVPLCMGLGVCAIALGHALYRLTTRTIIEVTSDEFVIRRVNPLLGASRVRWRRSSVTEVKRSLNGTLLVRAAGREMTSFFISAHPDVTVAVAGKIQDAVFHGEFRAGAASQAAPNAQRSFAVNLLLIASLCGVLLGVALLFIPDAAAVATAVLAIAIAVAVVTAGVAFGTQNKDFFT